MLTIIVISRFTKGFENLYLQKEYSLQFHNKSLHFIFILTTQLSADAFHMIK